MPFDPVALRRKLSAKAAEITARITPEQIMSDKDWALGHFKNPDYAVNGKPRADRLQDLASNIVSNSMSGAFRIIDFLHTFDNPLNEVNQAIENKKAEIENSRQDRPENILRCTISLELLEFLKTAFVEHSGPDTKRPGRPR